MATPFASVIATSGYGRAVPRPAFIAIVVCLALAFVGFFPFATDAQLFGQFNGAATRDPLITFSSYLRYALLVGATVGIVYYLVQSRGFPARERLVTAIRENPWLLLWMILLATSFVYSPPVQSNPVNAIVQIMTLPAALFVVVYLGSSRNIVLALYWALAFCLVASFVGVALLPDRSIHTVENQYIALSSELRGMWRGAFAHKNIAGGFFMQLLLICTTFLIAGEKRLLALAIGIGAAIFVVYSGSMSSIFAPVGALLVATPILARLRIARLLPDLFTMAYIAFPFSVALYLYQFGASFDSRDLIWQTAITYSRGHLALGHGYLNGFGTREMAGVHGQMWMRFIGHAHSGVMDMFLYFGILGLAGVYLTIRTVLWNYVRLFLEAGRGGVSCFDVAGLLVFLAATIRCMVEPDILTPRGGWLVMLIVGLLPSVQLWQRRMASRAARPRNDDASLFGQEAGI